MDRARMNQESANGVPLSSRMLDLLTLIITAIDLRRDIIDVPPEPGYTPETCGACSGTGHIMVLTPEAQGRDEDQDEDDEFYVDGGRDDGDDDDDGNAPAPTSGAAPSLNPTLETVPASAIEAPTASAGGCSGATAGESSSSAPFYGYAGAPAGPSSVAGPSSAAGPSFGVGPSSATGPPAGAGAVSFSVPTPVVPISGIHPLPPNTPVPMPDQAVYANAGSSRYYMVTRGLRVGVFEGWPRVSPYVTGVQMAVYSRHRTLQEAYDAYCIAYAQGSVRYA